MDEKNTAKAFNLSQKAVYYEQAKRYEEAIFCYTESANLLLKLLQEKKCMLIYRKNVKEYIDRAEFLKANLEKFQKKYPTIEENILESVEFLMLKADLYKEDDRSEQACKIFENVVEHCLKSSKNSQISPESKRKLREHAEKALISAEELQNIRKVKEIELSLPDVPSSSNLGAFISTPSPGPSPSGSPTKGKFTKEELNVLSSTSNINNKLYVPFHRYDQINEFKGQVGKFTDPDGKIGLTQKQKSRLKGWKRVSELYESPVVISSIDCASIKQTLISDCSFISSLSIAALYENKFKKQLVTSIIYPQDSSGKPIYNPAGKYMIKFHINGTWRKVVIDDYFPVDENDRIMCSHTDRKGELWVSLLEKAYMKIMGGYDFPGSNSNIDLNALTGWIPERISIQTKATEFDGDKVFRKLFDRMHRGDCLVTLATGRLSQEDCERAGLVETHAYAVIDIRCVDNKRLLKLKNPWTHLRWKGNYSEKDKINWTKSLQQQLNYDPEQAALKDDGVFWIDFESACHFFDVFYVNWNPELFPFTSVYHATWNQCSGPVKDLYTVGDNPQYLLTVDCTGKKNGAAVWILLTRHITRIDDFAENKEYITVMIYEANGKKIYIPSDPKPISDGVRINSPHYLCQLVTKPNTITKYTLVVAQYEKTTTINYSLRFYSSMDVKFEPLKLPYTISKTHKGQWDGNVEPGKGASILKFTLHSKTDTTALFFELKAPKQFSVAIELKQVTSDRTIFFETKNTGPYRPGYTVLQLENVPAGQFFIKLATYQSGQKGPYLLRIDSTSKFDVENHKIV
ncbi:unnamed protein product [Caenorhabditis angaria]|uniref:Calpain catalytic domain-containing protein n=1 Tax=Caenorhabditis angaria TaxID=860376 RepID=A0A9P1IGR5_9PELO|nr:unnamed protein product [Caenorhabditis angaria]